MSSRFCFLSFSLVSHCDFGGMSYVRTAAELLRRGHDVRWVFSRGQRDFHQETAEAVVSKHGIPVARGRLMDLVLSAKGGRRDLAARAHLLGRFFEEQAFDCIVVDRSCILGPFAAAAAGRPWAIVGNDGRKWTYADVAVPGGSPASDGMVKTTVPGSWLNPRLAEAKRIVLGENGTNVDADSIYATSPYLAISFFPRSYFEGFGNLPIPGHSHFLGSGPHPASEAERNTVLVTFGNTFEGRTVNPVVEAVRRVATTISSHFLILTGRSDGTQMLQRRLGDVPNIEVRDFVYYDEAYRTAAVALGHGGVSHIWYALREGIPLIAIPSRREQVFGAQRVEELGVGKAVYMTAESLDQLGPEPFVEALASAIPSVLADPGYREQAAAYCDSMVSGGGVATAATLLERLASEKAPVVV